MKDPRLIFCITLLLISVCLSGCSEKSSNDGNQQHNTDNEFIGDWEIVSSSSDYETWSFYTNRSAKNILTQDIEGQLITTISWYDYTKDNTSVCISTKNQSPDSPNYISMCFSYSFSGNATHLALSSNDIVIMELVKIS
jgi:hypothetical protein